MRERHKRVIRILIIAAAVCAVLFMGAMALRIIRIRTSLKNMNETEVSAEDKAGKAPADVKGPEDNPDETNKYNSSSDVPVRGRNTVVVYFSCTGNTREIAERIASLTKADLYEIKPKEAYSEDDINWRDESSRASLEQKDSASRPELESEPISFEGYKFVFIGYPIWFGEEPRIMDTFVESADLSGTRIIPFCTSGSSPIGSSAENLKELSNNKSWKEGQRFDTAVSDKELINWLTEVWGDVEREKEPLEDIGESYYKEASSADVELDADSGLRYVKNQLLISCELGTPKEKVEKICKKYDAEIVGYLEITSDFQIEFKEDKTLKELEETAEELEDKYDFVRMVTLNLVSEITYD